MPNARLLLLAALAAVSLAIFAWYSRQPPPNVLLVVIDTLRADHLGSYGYTRRPTSPRLDALAAAGTRFAHTRAPSSWTGPSVASIFTALYPAVHGLEQNVAVLSEKHHTMAEAFRDAGYATAAFSANPAFVTPEVGLGKGFDTFELLYGPPVEEGQLARDTTWAEPGSTRRVEVAKADRVTEAALSWLGKRERPDGPFFLYVHYFDPHFAYMPPPEWAERFGVPRDSPLAGAGQRMVMAAPQSRATVEQMETIVALYDAEIAFTDHEIGRLLDHLAEADVGPTLVVVTSDHGEEFGDHGGWQHSMTLWEEQLRVPLVLAGPGVPPGVVVEHPVSLVDLWPTIADVARQPARTPPTSRSFAGLLDGAADAPRAIFADLVVPNRIHTRAVFHGNWKLIVGTDTGAGLYNLAADPAERRDLHELRTEIMERMRTALGMRDAAAVTARAEAEPGVLTLTSERAERLRALGYLH